MSIANGANHQLAYVAETVAGTTPALPVFKIIPHTGTTLGTTKDAQTSANLGGRQIKCFKHGNVAVQGDTSHEVTYGAHDELIEAALCGTWATNTLKAGVTRRTFTVERFFPDADSATYIRYRGAEVNTMNINVAPNAIPTITFGWIGVDQDPTNVLFTGATYTPDASACPFDSFTGVVSEGGVSVGVATQLQLTLENGIEALYAIGDNAAIGKSIGKSNVTGNMTIYFENATIMNKFLANTESSIEVTLTGSAGSLTFDVPRLSFTSGAQPDVSGDGSVTLAVNFQGLYDPTDASNIVVTRVAA